MFSYLQKNQTYKEIENYSKSNVRVEKEMIRENNNKLKIGD